MKILTSLVAFLIMVPILFSSMVGQNERAPSVKEEDAKPVEDSKQDQDQDKIPIPNEGAVERRDFMRLKLQYTQNILEGLTIRDFDLIDNGVAEMEKLLEAEQWVTIDNDEYRSLVNQFRTAVQRVKTASAGKNIEATALRFYEMSTSCIDCHAHLKHAGYHF